MSASATKNFCDQLIANLVDRAIASPDEQAIYEQIIGRIVIMVRSATNTVEAIEQMIEKYKPNEPESSTFGQHLEAIKNNSYVSVGDSFLDAINTAVQQRDIEQFTLACRNMDSFNELTPNQVSELMRLKSYLESRTH